MVTLGKYHLYTYETKNHYQYVHGDRNQSHDDLKKCALRGNEYGVISATIDGVQVKNLQGYRTQTGFFNITIPADNIYDAPSGTFKAMADGFFVFLEPMKTGHREVVLTASVLNPVDTQYNYNAKWTYHLIIG